MKSPEKATERYVIHQSRHVPASSTHRGADGVRETESLGKKTK